MKVLIAGSNGMASVVPARGGGVRDWQRWAPYAAVAWSLVYATMSAYWAVSGRGFPYAPKTMSDIMGPLLGRFGPGVAWIVVMMAGIPAVAMGAAMLRGLRSKALRPLFITAGVLLAGFLLLLMTGLDLLVLLGYIPYTVRGLFIGDKISRAFLEAWTQWATIHQLLCLIGGFLWLAATVSYARRSADACLYCGRRNELEGWNSPDNARRWGRIAVYVAMVVPVFYALTRYAWALGFPLGMSEEYLRQGQERGTWISGLFLATFGLVGAVLMLGLVQRWGEVFPRWLVGLAGRRVPIALAVVPASLASVLLIVGGIGIWSSLAQMVANLVSDGAENIEIIGAIIFQVGPTLLFPVWGVALAVATLGYYFRRRGPCSVCGRGASDDVGESSFMYQGKLPDEKHERKFIMINILKKQNGMNIVGQGGKIILFMLPSLIAAILVHKYLPHIAALPRSIDFIKPVGYVLLVPGLVLWGAAVIQLMAGFSKGRLVTTGAYGVVRNPIYSSVTFFILPAVALMTLTWGYLIVSVFLYVGVMIFIGVEEQQLTHAFGQQYKEYLASVDRLVPFKKP